MGRARAVRFCAAGAILALSLALAGPAASATELPQEMEGLVTEGKKGFQESGNTELGTAERNAARVKAWRSLWPAREILDRFEDEHPRDLARADAKYVQNPMK